MGPDDRDRELLRRIRAVRHHQLDKTPAATARGVLRGSPACLTLRLPGQGEEDYRAEIVAFATVLDALESGLVERVQRALVAERPGGTG